MTRRTAPPRPPAEPPATTEAGAALVREFVVRLYDRRDGQGVEWETIAGTLFRAAFDVLANCRRRENRCSRIGCINGHTRR